jgi:hypothetical protein
MFSKKREKFSEILTTLAISTKLKFVSLEARNWKGPKIDRDEDGTEHAEPLSVAQRRLQARHLAAATWRLQP